MSSRKRLQYEANSMDAVKAAAMKAGMKFPANAPLRTLATVPREARTVQDVLKISSSEELFPAPDLDQFIGDTGLYDEDVVALRKLFDDYRELVVQGYMALYEESAKVLTEIDNKMIFYLDLYSHVDGSLRDLVRDKLASLFKADVKADLLLHSSSKKLTDKPQGLFGGDSKMRSVLNESAKTRSLLSKAVPSTRGGVTTEEETLLAGAARTMRGGAAVAAVVALALLTIADTLDDPYTTVEDTEVRTDEPVVADNGGGKVGEHVPAKPRPARARKRNAIEAVMFDSNVEAKTKVRKTTQSTAAKFI